MAWTKLGKQSNIVVRFANETQRLADRLMLVARRPSLAFNDACHIRGASGKQKIFPNSVQVWPIRHRMRAETTPIGLLRRKGERDRWLKSFQNCEEIIRANPQTHYVNVSYRDTL